jgi:hypothetical protein
MSPSRLLIRKRSRAARKGEAHILDYEFPPHLEARVRRRFPQLDDQGWALVEQGLREWFVCCAWRSRSVLGMPSRLVDEGWHEFILDSLSYTQFCNAAFGDYLHHTPDEAMSTSMSNALNQTVLAWDRSDIGSDEDSVLWDLDERLGPGPFFGGGGWIGGEGGAGGGGGEGGGGCGGGGGGCGGGGS